MTHRNTSLIKRGLVLVHSGIKAVSYRLVIDLSAGHVCDAEEKAILSTACLISSYMHSPVSCSRSIRRVNKSILSVSSLKVYPSVQSSLENRR